MNSLPGLRISPVIPFAVWLPKSVAAPGGLCFLTYRLFSMYQCFVMNINATEIMGMESLESAAECLRTIAHPSRLRMIEILLGEERSVGELAEACHIPSHMASEPLRLLKDRGLLKSRREGRKVFYSVAEPMLANIIDCVGKKFICKD